MRESRTRFVTIACPNCGYEYLPAELFVSTIAFGNPGEIQRDDNGKIIDFTGTSLDLKETYECDKCGKTFKINGKMNFNVELDKTLDFDEDYSFKLTNDKITCKEDF